MKAEVKGYCIINTLSNKVVMQFEKDEQIFNIYDTCNRLNRCLGELDRKTTYYNVITLYEIVGGESGNN